MIKEFRKYLEIRMDISDLEFKEIAKLLELKKVLKGERLLQTGETCLHGYFVIKGCLRSYCVSNGKEYMMQFAPENWWIGDKNMLTKPDISLVCIDAIEDSWVLQFDCDFYESMEKINPNTRYLIQELQQNSYRSLQKRIMTLISVSAEERYNLFVKTYPGLINRIPLQMIASYLGITPQSLSRVRSKKILTSY